MVFHQNAPCGYLNESFQGFGKIAIRPGEQMKHDCLSIEQCFGIEPRHRQTGSADVLLEFRKPLAGLMLQRFGVEFFRFGRGS